MRNAKTFKHSDYSHKFNWQYFKILGIKNNYHVRLISKSNKINLMSKT